MVTLGYLQTPNGGVVSPHEDVDEGELQQGGDDEEKTGRHPHVQGRHVTDAGQLVPDAGKLRCHGEHGQQAQRDSRGNRVHVEPERDPGDEDDGSAGEVHLCPEVPELPGEVQLGPDTSEATWTT